MNGGNIAERFFVDERKAKNGISITDASHKLRETFQWQSLEDEVEARWRLVETAWDLGVTKNIITVNPDPTAERLIAHTPGRRVNVTSSRSALNGYQKGRCFYCYDEISIKSGNERVSDVDHFLPWTLEEKKLIQGLNGVWNLVLSCKECNRGENGKFALVPSETLLDRLEKRNNCLIQSHHPLRETLRLQTGADVHTRRSFLKSRYDQALSYMHHTWEPEPKGPAIF